MENDKAPHEEMPKLDADKLANENAERMKQGLRKANRAALYANLRTILVASMRPEKPLVGIHLFGFDEDNRLYIWSAGATPALHDMMRGVGSLQGWLIANAVNMQLGELKKANVGDGYDPLLDKTRCLSCEDGDPTGEHAEEELRLNAKAWLGVTCMVADLFYGPYLSDKTKEALKVLLDEALPANLPVS